MEQASMRVLKYAIALALTATTASLAADQKGFLGRWNLTGTGENSGYVYWLEVKEDAGQLSGRLLNRGGSPVPLDSVKVEGDELVFQLTTAKDRPPTVFRARQNGDKLQGSVTLPNRTVEFVGARPPKWGTSDADAKHSYGKAVELFDGKSMDAWDVQDKNRPSGWTVADGSMTNEPHANNLVSKQKFKDFKIHAEYKLEKDSNSGIYLRGRYELQVLDDYGKPTEAHGHMSIYAWKAPLVNASKPAGEWQTMDAVLVGNRVTVTLNGQKVQDNSELQAITGGALDANETEPGPIVLQGDHGKVWFRKVTVTPMTK
jgi:hypothetical protein